MKKFKNKFILIIIVIMALIIFSQGYMAYSQSKKDTNSYVTLIKGKALHNDVFLRLEMQQILSSGDKIHTQDDSLAVITWGDGSLTRLGENTKITIEQNQISKDFTDIHISFDLIAGKTWSQVVSFIGTDSSFTQTFGGIEAGVRGTIFDVDLENDFVRVTDHELEVRDTTSGEEQIISQGEIFTLSDFSLVQLSEFIRDIENKAWTNINTSLDKEYISVLNEKLQESLNKNSFLDFLLSKFSAKHSLLKSLKTAEDFSQVEEKIKNISQDQRASIYQAVLSEYQKYNYISIGDYENYKRKVFFKKALILLGEDQGEIQRLMETTSYDLRDAAKNKITQGLEESFDVLQLGNVKIPNVNLEMPQLNFDYLPEDLQLQFREDFSKILESFSIDMIQIPTNISNLDSTMQDILDGTLGEFLK